LLAESLEVIIRQQDEIIPCTIGDLEHLLNRGDIEVLTGSGYSKLIRLKKCLQDHYIEVLLENGIRIRGSDSLAVETLEGPVSIGNLRRGDMLLLKIPHMTGDFKALNLLMVIDKIPPWLTRYLYVDGLSSTLDKALKVMNWRSIALLLGMRISRTTYEWLTSGYLPLAMFKGLLSELGVEVDSLEELTLKLRRGRTQIPLLIKPDDDYMRLISYYVNCGAYSELQLDKGKLTFIVHDRESLDRIIDTMDSLRVSHRIVRMPKGRFRVKLNNKTLYILFRWILRIPLVPTRRRILHPPLSSLSERALARIMNQILEVNGLVTSRIGSEQVFEVRAKGMALDIMRLKWYEGIKTRLSKLDGRMILNILPEKEDFLLTVENVRVVKDKSILLYELLVDSSEGVLAVDI